MQIPSPGDLISIVAETDGVLISGNEQSKNSKYRQFGWSIVKVSPDQNGLVLESYKPNALSNKLPVIIEEPLYSILLDLFLCCLLKDPDVL